jgi:hypothetical protein
MAKMKRHSKVEIATKLAQANDLLTQGNGKAISRARLGSCVMDLASVAQIAC